MLTFTLLRSQRKVMYATIRAIDYTRVYMNDRWDLDRTKTTCHFYSWKFYVSTDNCFSMWARILATIIFMTQLDIGG